MRFRRYLPKLKGFPSRYIYEPWNAPESIQKAAKCVIGVDYPRPIVNHAEASRLNIERMKQVYQQLSRYRGLCKEPPPNHPFIPKQRGQHLQAPGVEMGMGIPRYLQRDTPNHCLSGC